MLSFSEDPQAVSWWSTGHGLAQLGAQAILFETNSLAGLIEQPSNAQHRRSGGFHG